MQRRRECTHRLTFLKLNSSFGTLRNSLRLFDPFIYTREQTSVYISCANHKIKMGRSPCCDKNGVKKGPWTPEEDQKLIDYIRFHGPGNWRILPKNAGKLYILYFYIGSDIAYCTNTY